MDHLDSKAADKFKHPAHKKKANLDPITKAPGSHPVGTGIGAAGVGAAGAATGAIAAGAVMGAAGGPLGALVGGAIGAIAGGAAGHFTAESVNPTREDAYWRENYAKRPYVTEGETYDFYRPAYEYGWTSHERHAGKKFDDVEAELITDWEEQGYSSRLEWDRAKFAARDAWDRLDRPLPLEGKI